MLDDVHVCHISLGCCVLTMMLDDVHVAFTYAFRICMFPMMSMMTVILRMQDDDHVGWIN